ncbi:MAG: efflux RND transporter periplasmic adaptor subunit [Dysgonamonadaceae bacterium]|jgi:membrane fusion protein (multidrug efflux system)|nr:efflux RND transporter periplasmic adaptor subunit [Dysgonamonadaceae bacterium]
MSKSTKIGLLAIIVLLIAGMALYPTIKKSLKKDEPGKVTSAAPSGGGERRGASLNVNVEIVKSEPLSSIIITTGNVYPDEEVDLTFETAGKVTDIFFKEGTAVTKGALLAKVNDKPLLAELHKLEAQIPLAEGRVFRQKSLLEKDAVSQESYEQVTTELEKLHADIELVSARITQTELRAPFDGMIGLRKVSEGAYVSPTTVIAPLTKIKPLKIEFSVNERYRNDLKPGTSFNFRTVNGEEFSATIYAVEARVALTTRTLQARALFPNTEGKLKPGAMATIRVESKDVRNAILAPNEAIIAEMGRNIAYIYSGGRARRVELENGERSEARIPVWEGLHPGDTLIVSGVMQLRDGLPVTIDNILGQ